MQGSPNSIYNTYIRTIFAQNYFQAEEDQHAVLFTLDYSIVAELKYTLNKEGSPTLFCQYAHF